MIEIQPVAHINARIEVPGSKSITQRALIVAALAEGKSKLIGPLESEDTKYSTAALRQMGIVIDKDNDWQIRGNGGRIEPSQEPIYLGNNGTSTRLLTSVASLGTSLYIIDGDRRMYQRPIEPLITALCGWGVDIVAIRGTGCPPLQINGRGLSGGTTILPEGKSSQYLSSLLLVAPYARSPAKVKVLGNVFSKPYVAMTLAVMEEFGIEVDYAPDFSFFSVPQGRYRAREYRIEGDASNASYFWAAAAVTGGRVTVTNIPVPSLQGDAMLLPLLGRMGCEIIKNEDGISLQGSKHLKAIEVDMANMPDVVPTLAVVAAFAQGITTINNISHLRIKECDRLSAMVTELTKLGVRVEEGGASMAIHGNGGANLKGAKLATYEDHRMAMSLAVAGLRVPGVQIAEEQCVAKSFPDFWQIFSQLATG